MHDANGTRITVPTENLVQGDAGDAIARVYDLTREQWILVERIDAKEMVSVGSHAWAEPEQP